MASKKKPVLTGEQGAIEAFDGRVISGWYFNPEGSQKTLSVYFDHELLCGVSATLPRIDMQAEYANVISICGFHTDLSYFSLLTRCSSVEELRRRLLVSSESGRSLQHVYDDPFNLPVRKLPSNRSELKSCLDQVENGIITGWVAIYGQVERLLVHIYVDDIFQGEVTADLFRDDIGKLHQDYYSGFSFNIANNLLDDDRHKISCLLASTGQEIGNSPRSVFLPRRATITDARLTKILELSDKVEQQISELRLEISSLVGNGNTGLISYPYFQEVIQAGRFSIARLSKTKIASPALFSIAMPTYKTPLPVLERAIDSVVAQTDSSWELVISDSASRSGPLRDYLEFRSENDSRIRVVYNDDQLGISCNMNVAINACLGEFVGFLDHDDELAPEAVSLNRAAFDTGLYDLVYSDEDKIDSRGNYIDPHYKPAFNYHLLLSMNYICHFVCVRKSELIKTGLNRSEFDGAQDWDLLLRLVQQIDRFRIGHIPRVLYHWRMMEGSTALGADRKSYAADAGVKAVSVHLFSLGENVVVDRSSTGLPYVEVRWRHCKETFLSIIIPTKDRLELVTNCVNSLRLTIGDIDYEILIIDNDSSRLSTEAFEKLCKDCRVRLLHYRGPFNYSAINNFAAKYARGEYLLLLNNDVFFQNQGWAEQMLGIASRPDTGAVGLKLLYPDNRVQHCGVVLGNGGVAGHAFQHLLASDYGYFARAVCTHQVSAVTAACLLVQANKYWEVGGLDEQYLKVAFNDVDLCMKLQEKGYQNIVVANTFAYHAESISRGFEDSPQKLERFQQEIKTMRERWGSALLADRFYSPNFDLDHACYSVLNLQSIVAQEANLGIKVLVR